MIDDRPSVIPPSAASTRRADLHVVPSPAPQRPSVRELLAELAGIEDTLRTCPLSERRAALAREEAILVQLHSIVPGPEPA